MTCAFVLAFPRLQEVKSQARERDASNKELARWLVDESQQQVCCGFENDTRMRIHMHCRRVNLTAPNLLVPFMWIDLCICFCPCACLTALQQRTARTAVAALEARIDAMIREHSATLGELERERMQTEETHAQAAIEWQRTRDSDRAKLTAKLEVCLSWQGSEQCKDDHCNASFHSSCFLFEY